MTPLSLLNDGKMLRLPITKADVLLLDISAWPGLLKAFINISLDEVESESGR